MLRIRRRAGRRRRGDAQAARELHRRRAESRGAALGFR
jgi:hypothetical protein